MVRNRSAFRPQMQIKSSKAVHHRYNSREAVLKKEIPVYIHRTEARPIRTSLHNRRRNSGRGNEGNCEGMFATKRPERRNFHANVVRQLR